MFWKWNVSNEQRLDNILKNTPMIDTHNDFPYLIRTQLHNEFQNNPNFDFENYLHSHTDLNKLKQGRLGIQFFSCYIESKDPDPLSQDFNKPNNVVRDTLEQIDVTKRLTNTYSSLLKFVNTSDEAIKTYYKGKLAVAIGVEGLHQVDTSLAVLRQYFDLGVRYITLTHNCDNPFATAASSVAGGLVDRGLTHYGEKCIQEMNRLGIMVDLSHVSVKTMHDSLRVSKSPVIFSHSSVYSLTNHKRNVNDEVLYKLKNNNGVICINFFPSFIQQNDKQASIDDAVDHIIYVANLIGWDHVGLGSDFDGIPVALEGLEDVSKYPDLILKVMEKSNASDKDILKLVGKNILRVWEENERIAKGLQGESPIEDNWSNRFWDNSLGDKLPELFPGSKKS